MLSITDLFAEYKFAALAVVLVVCYAWGRHDGAALESATQAREEKLIEKTNKAAQQGAADEIAKIEVKNVTNNRRIERETRQVPVYRDCRHSTDGLRAINDALENRAVAAGDRELPAEPGQPERR